MIASASHRKKSRLRRTAARYRDARRSLHTPASRRSRLGLDWTNFFIADVQTGFGTFVAFYLAHLGWSQRDVGIALTIGGLAGVLSQIPGGALADATTWKRGLVAAGIVMIGAAAMILALTPSPILVWASMLLHGITAGIITPAISAISLGLVGLRAMSVRTGRNYRYAAGGHAATAALMGLAGAYFAHGAIFIAAAALCIPALIALGFIKADEIDYRRARNAPTGQSSQQLARVVDLAKNHRLVLFAAALVLFQLADASMLPLIGENLATTMPSRTPLWMSGLIIIPQVVVALLAPWVGYHSERKGRKPLLLIGFGVEIARAALLAFSSGYGFLVAAQLLNGVSGAIIGVLTIMVVADLTAAATGFLFQGVEYDYHHFGRSEETGGAGRANPQGRPT
jgi:predicted MFS family arabinose efflux permease